MGGTANPYYLVSWKGLVYFTADGGGGRKIWKSDGTPGGTVEAVPAPPFSGPTQLTPLGDRLYFVANSPVDGEELWRLDGEVPSQVKDIWSGSGSSWPSDLTPVGSKIYFRAYTETAGEEPWVTDGTDAGTKTASSGAPTAPRKARSWSRTSSPAQESQIPFA